MQNTLHVSWALGNGEEGQTGSWQTRQMGKLLVARIQTVGTADFGVQQRSILMAFTSEAHHIGVIAI